MSQPIDPLMASLRPLLERVLREQEAAEEHQRVCTDRPCERCAKFVCRCGAPIDGGSRDCDACRAKARIDGLLAPTVQSIPRRFDWVIGAGLDLLSRRIRCSPEVLRRGIESPPSSWLCFVGQTGTGKTSLAIAMLDAWVRRNPEERTGAIFLEAAWLARARARHRLGEGEAPTVAAAMRAPLLVLDDLGSEREDRDGCITDVIYERHNAELPTWITCGLATTFDDLAEVLARRYDSGFMRRVLESGKRVQLGGDR